MNILSINTSTNELELGLFKDLNQIATLKIMTNNQLSEVLYSTIEDFLLKKSLKISDLDGINCYLGPGSFTGLRIGISLVNTLAYSLKIKIVGSVGKDWIKSGNQKLINHSDEKMVLPFYGAEVKVTTPKK